MFVSLIKYPTALMSVALAELIFHTSVHIISFDLESVFSLGITCSISTIIFL